MQRTMCIGKIHRATVTEADLSYVGSITIDKTLLDAAGILPYEQVQVVNCNNGARFETYTIEGEPGSGTICLNGAAARLAQIGDIIIIIAYAQMEAAEAQSYTPRLVFVDTQNHVVPAQGPTVEVGLN